MRENALFSASTTSVGYGLYINDRFEAGAYTTSTYAAVRINDPALGAGQTLTNNRGISINDLSVGADISGIRSEMTAAANKFFIYGAGDADSVFMGDLGIRVEPDSNVRLQVRNSTPAASPAWTSSDTLVVQSATSAGINVHAGAVGGTLRYGFSSAAVSNVGGVSYTPGSHLMILSTNSTGRIEIDSTSVRSIEPIEAPGFYVGGATDGLVGIVEGTTSGLAASSSYDSIVVSSTGNTGLSFMGLAGTSLQGVAFGDSGATTAGGMFYSHVDDELDFKAGNSARLVLGAAPIAQIFDGTSTGLGANTNNDSLVIDGTGSTGITFLGTAGSSVQAIRFGDSGSNVAGGMVYSHATDVLTFVTDASTRGSFDASGFDVTGNIAASGDLSAGDDLTVTDDATIGGTLTVTTSLVVTGAVSSTGTNKVAQSTSAGLTVTAGTNVPSGTVGTVFWTRIGDVVSVWGRVTPTFTSGDSPSSFDLSLPIASALTSADQLAGTFAPQAALDHDKAIYGSIFGNATNDRATFVIRSFVAGAQACSFSFAYRVV
jgi:hypothetical protein